ncbi:MAG: thiamine-phosphate kinase [Opitutales bacterium]
MSIWAKSIEDSYSSFGEAKTIKMAVEIFGDICPPSPYGSGDDCAIIDKSSLEEKLFVTTDSVIAGVHFDFDCDAIRAGKKLIKRNVSDIASMGALPIYAQTSAILSANLSMEYLKGFLLGMKLACEEYSIKIIGGDIASVKSDFFSMHLTLIGSSEGRAMLRTGGEVGDFICCTGTLGASYESDWHLDFCPRVQEGLFLSKLPELKACIDITDGIASDLKHLLSRTSCAVLDTDKIPLRNVEGNNLTKALCDGEDYELLFVLDKNCDFAKLNQAYQNQFKQSLHLIGEIKKANSPEEEFACFLNFPKENKILKLNKSGYSH